MAQSWMWGGQVAVKKKETKCFQKAEGLVQCSKATFECKHHRMSGSVCDFVDKKICKAGSLGDAVIPLLSHIKICHPLVYFFYKIN